MTFKHKLHSHGWFILINALISMLISLRYFAFLPEWPTDLIGGTFIIVSIIGQMSLLAGIFGALSIALLPLPSRSRNLLQALLASVGLALLFIDTNVFALYRFHINAVVLDLVLSGHVVTFPLVEWAMVIGSIVALFSAQYFLVRWLEKRPKVTSLKLGRKFTILVFLSLLATSSIHIWAAANVYQPVTIVKRYLPLFYPATANSFMSKRGWIDQKAIDRQKSMRMNTKSDLNYPLSPLETIAVEKPTNIMLLVIDSWRADTFSQEVTPNLWNIAQSQSATIFKNHMASGNSTRAGIFGLLNGIPSTYWHSFLANNQPSLLMTRMQELDYELGIFSAARLNRPEFDQTVFASVPNLRLGSTGQRPSQLDQDLTADWIKWNQDRDISKPAFSFLFYDSVHGYDFPADYEHRFEPMLSKVNHLELDNDTDPNTYFNLYKTSVHYTDSLIKQIFDELESSGQLDNTLVIITSDHGEEVNDNKLNFWGHNSNFTNAQVQVPFVVFGPGFNPEINWTSNVLTSHADLVPTLMKNYLGVNNPLSDYSTGEDLLGKAVDRGWVISAKYSGYAVITKDTILEVFASGDYSVMDKTNRELKGDSVNYGHLKEALEVISRYHR